jgi:hypothetical protein
MKFAAAVKARGWAEPSLFALSRYARREKYGT